MHRTLAHELFSPCLFSRAWYGRSIVYYRAVYGGYSGDLTPEESLKMLKESNAILLDLRKEVRKLPCRSMEKRGGGRRAIHTLQLP